ncbi:pyruvate formate-lyase [Desulfovibrio sp. 3_1_syn3]|uniref:glycyl radical protein n=1 Tax=Desulfovibrio sp. 3_1_syn3 TaxID=457398 RepID=UPI0001E12764|nr:formate C-acetyltransferase/glycerol dehydratase family glycyl radical enzyme [Desulfovibrio sp. 3_1_syn3]EFL86109.1 pyruvate formate-lyase [Desulfovibrio sp. 3_1_syn3]
MAAKAPRYQMMDMVSERIRRLRERFIATVPEISAQRARIVTAAYEDTMNMPAVLRRGVVLSRILEEMDIYIADDELLVGGMAEMPRGVPLFPEYAVDFIMRELDEFETRVADRFVLPPETKEELRRLLPRWEGACLNDYAFPLFSEEGRKAAGNFCYLLTATRSGVGHMIVDYEYWLQKGIPGIIADLEGLRDSVDRMDPEACERLEFYKSALLMMAAARRFVLRYAALAHSQAETCAGDERRRELELIAQTCEHLAAHKPETFRQACQSFLFLHLILQLEANGHSVSPGRFDQYMYPFFKADLEAAPNAGEMAEELIHCLWIKLSEINKVRDKLNSIAFGGYPMFQHITLGGQDKDGKCAVNELSYMCLDATARVGLFQPSTSIRWFYGMPDEFLNFAVRIASFGTGMPAFFNDEVLIPNMLQLGYNLEQARGYAVVGCTEETVPGVAEPWLTGGFFNLAKMIEYTIFDGMDITTGEQQQFRTGAVEDFGSFEDFVAAYKKQLGYYVRLHIACDNILDIAHARLMPTVFEGIVMQGCKESGKSSMQGGALFNSTTINAVGIANVADSLACIRQAVYEDKIFTWAALKDALRANYVGHEKIRAYMKNRVPKYGTDTEAVDAIGNDIVNELYAIISLYKNPRNGPYLLALYSISTNVMVADRTGATPDGRKMGESLADGGVSCSHGVDKEGPTALLNSVAKLDPYKATGSTLLNLKLHPSVFEDDRNIAKVSALFKTFFLNKGQHIQLNVVDAATLRDAQKHPEKHAFLTVRVAGFSVFFTTIDPRTQEEIIARTEHFG